MLKVDAIRVNRLLAALPTDDVTQRTAWALLQTYKNCAFEILSGGGTLNERILLIESAHVNLIHCLEHIEEYLLSAE